MGFRRSEAWLGGREVTALASDANGWLALVEGSDGVLPRARRRGGDPLGEVVEETGEPPPAGTVRCSSARPSARLAMTDGARSRWSRSFDEAQKDGRPGTRRGEARPTLDRWLARRRTELCSRTSTSAGSSGRRRPKESVVGRRSTSTPTSTRSSRTDLDPGHVVAATARGLAESSRRRRDLALRRRGARKRSYARAVALDGERLYLSASNGPRGGRAGRRSAGAWGGRLSKKCGGGLPEWFGWERRQPPPRGRLGGDRARSGTEGRERVPVRGRRRTPGGRCWYGVDASSRAWGSLYAAPAYDGYPT